MLVLLDLDDTLCNTWEAGKYTILRLLPYLLKKKKFRALFYILTSRYRDLEQVKELHLMDLDKILEKAMRKVYSHIPQNELDEMFELVDRVFFSNLKLFPDARPFLEELRKMDAKIVLITDSSSYWQRKKLEYLGIKDYFDSIVISGETGHSKFELYNFILAKKLFPVESEIYMIGDRDETDMKGGKAIGAITILVNRGYFRGRGTKNADYIVRNLMEALEVIKHEHEKRA